MQHVVRLAALAPIVLLGFLASPAVAQEGVATPHWSFTGGFQVGFRSIEVEGREEKYREDLNLEDGPRLFNLDFELVPTPELRRYFDRVELDLSNLGGDPFETLRLSVEKYGSYRFKYDKRKSAYFYEDVIVPVGLASPSLADGGDFHTFDFERERDTASLEIRLSQAARVSFGFDRFTKRGNRTTTLDIQRDEFEFEAPVDESLNEYRAGFEYSWKRVTLVLEETIRDYENFYEVLLPGQSLGADREDETVLDFFFLDQPYDFTSQTHGLRLVARPNDRLLLRFGGSLQSLDLDLETTERSRGLDFLGVPFATDLSGAGDAERDLELFDLDLSYQVSNRLALLGGVKSKALDQEASLLQDGSLDTGDWGIDTTSLKMGLSYAVSPTLSLTGGFLQEERDVDFRRAMEDEAAARREETEHTGHFLTLGWRPSRQFRLTATYENSSYNDPFTLASPTDRKRYRLRAQYGGGEGLSVSGSFLRHDVDNSNSGWAADIDQLRVRLGYRRGSFAGSLGYSLVASERMIDQLVIARPSTERPFLIFYEIDSSFVDGRLLWAFHRRWRLGGTVKLYQSDGSFGVDRDDLHGWIEVELKGGYVAHAGLRTIDYDEERGDFDDFQADILEISLGYRW